jgi:hypothetical protein
VLALFLCFASSAAALPGDTARISVSQTGSEGNNPSSEPSMSPDGRYVAFTSQASNLIEGDTNNTFDVFVHDRQEKTIERVSLGEGLPGETAAEEGPGSAGEPGSAVVQGNGPSREPAISDDGRFVAFASTASNFLSFDTNGFSDVFVYDRVERTIERVNVGEGGEQANRPSTGAAISGDGNVVAFPSAATNLVSGVGSPVPPFRQNVYVRELGTGQTSVVSGGEGSGGNGNSLAPALSEDGNFVAFESAASNLGPKDGNPASDVYLFERATQMTELISSGEGGTAANSGSFRPSIGENGNLVVFASAASNLVAGDVNFAQDVFAHERGAPGPELVSVGEGGEPANGWSAGNDAPAVSEDGRYVVFSSTATNLTAGISGVHDIFRHDRTTGINDTASVSSGGSIRSNGASSHPAVSDDGEAVGFQSTGSSLVPEDGNTVADVFVHEPGGEAVPPDAVGIDFTGSGAPVAQSETALSPAYVSTTADFAWDPLEIGPPPLGSPVALPDAVIHFDDDFSFDAEGIPVCTTGSLTGTSTAAALAACPESRIGSGYFESGFGAGILTLFNGPPDGGHPTVLVHVLRVLGVSEFPELRTGTLRPSSRGGDFGTELDLSTMAVNLTHLELTLGGEPVTGHRYVQARCGDPDRAWNFASEYTLSYGLYVLPQTSSVEASEECSLAADIDEDGIDDQVDLEPNGASTGFSDGDGNTGEIVDTGGLDVKVADAAAPRGVFVSATEASPAPGPAVLSVCGGAYTIELAAGTEEFVTCGSVIVQVVRGEGTVVAGGGSIVVSVPVGGEAEVADNGDGTYSVENKGTTSVTVSVGGIDEILDRGKSTLAAPPPPADIALSPLDATKPVSSTHTVTATVRTDAGHVLAGVPVRFIVSGSVSTSGSCDTGSAGMCSFSYQGPVFPGADGITAYADADDSGTHDAGEPAAEAATVAWVLPDATPGQVTGGGQVTGDAGDKIAFGFKATGGSDGHAGNCNLVDPARKTKLRCVSVTSMNVNGSEATLFGQATVNGESTAYRIHVEDLGEPSGSDSFTIHTASGYEAGGTLKSGNIQLH